jgi:hypothetical protein
MADPILPAACDFHGKCRDLLHAANLRHGTDGFTSPPKEVILRIFFAGLNPRTWVPEASMLTTRPLKPPTGVLLTTVQSHNSTVSPRHDRPTGRYAAWLVYSMLWSCLFECNDETEYRISLPIRSAAFLWASLRSGSRHIMFPDHLTGRYVLPYLSIPLQNGTVRYQDRITDDTASWVTVGYVIISSLVYPLWCYKPRRSAPPKQQLTSAFCTDTCQLTIRYVAKGLAQVEFCANRNWVYIQSAVFADTGELGWTLNSNTLETNRPQHVIAQQYSSTIFISLRFHSCMKKFVLRFFFCCH